MKILGIIPARYESTRFPAKMLAPILGKSMIRRVYEQACKSNILSEVIVATDHQKILNHIIEINGNVILTSNKHSSGTERCNEVVSLLKNDFDAIINIQGDEPFIDPKQIDKIGLILNHSLTEITTLAKEIKSTEEFLDYNTPKVKFDDKMIATNFLRRIQAPSKNIALYIKKHIFYKHIGIYGYKTSILKKIASLKPSQNEIKENLEQLRWLDNGYKIKIGLTTKESISIDIPEDIIKINKKIQ